MNKVELQGKLSRDCHITETKNGNKMCFITVQATRDGGSDFLPVKAFNISETMIPALIKGADVYVSGRLQAGKYDKQQQKQLYDNIVVAEEIRVINRVINPRCVGDWSFSALPAPTASTAAADN